MYTILEPPDPIIQVPPASPVFSLVFCPECLPVPSLQIPVIFPRLWGEPLGGTRASNTFLKGGFGAGWGNFGIEFLHDLGQASHILLQFLHL